MPDSPGIIPTHPKSCFRVFLFIGCFPALIHKNLLESEQGKLSKVFERLFSVFFCEGFFLEIDISKVICAVQGYLEKN